MFISTYFCLICETHQSPVDVLCLCMSVSQECLVPDVCFLCQMVKPRKRKPVKLLDDMIAKDEEADKPVELDASVSDPTPFSCPWHIPFKYSLNVSQ